MLTIFDVAARLRGVKWDGKAALSFICPIEGHNHRGTCRELPGGLITLGCIEAGNIWKAIDLVQGGAGRGETQTERPSVPTAHPAPSNPPADQPKPSPEPALEQKPDNPPPARAKPPERVPDPLPPRPTTPPSIQFREMQVAHWQGAMFDEARQLVRQPIYQEKDALLLALAQVANHAPQASSTIWPTGIDREELEGALAVVATKALTANGVAIRKEDDFSERTAIDAYEVHRLMVTDKRGYSVAGLIKEGCTMIVSGLMGAGKSTFAMNLARAWALGEDFLGRPTKQSKTLVVVSPKEMEAWADTVGFWKIQGCIFLVESMKAHFHDPKDQVRWFEHEMDRLGCMTFVLDTLFDFYGTPANNTGDQNRVVMNEQAPFLQMVRERMFSGLVTGHPPKSEAHAPIARDPEESFGGHTAWTAQHRMRGTIRRKSAAASVNAFITGKGGYGDEGVLKETILLLDLESRLLSFGGSFADYLGIAALPSVIEALSGWMSRSELDKAIGKDKKWTLAGIREGLKQGSIKDNGKKARARKYALPEEPEQDELFG